LHQRRSLALLEHLAGQGIGKQQCRHCSDLVSG
jgi:hypothetical protein